MVELLIEHNGTMVQPAVEDGIRWETDRRGSPSKLTFTALQDDDFAVSEGDPVRFSVDEVGVFYGFVFTVKRTKTSSVSITAYDQLRYLKNKDTYVYESKSASDVVKMIAADFNLNLGDVDPTAYVIPSRVEENSTLFDIIQNALDLELMNSKQLFVLMDDFGKLCLRDISKLRVGILIDDETASNYDYSSSIDGDTYNKVKLSRKNDKTGMRDVWIAQSGENINRWGVLQYTEDIDENEDGQSKADALLELYNSPVKTLKITDAFGDIKVRAGTMIGVRLGLTDLEVNSMMLVEKATHTFKRDQHLMSLTLKGGEINGQ